MVLRLSQYVSLIRKLQYCTKSNSKHKLYGHTIFLPKTEFPLRLDKKVCERDEHIYKTAGFEGFYEWQRSHLSEPEFVLHDGPPYANGRPHMGHAINKILKDTVLRYQMLKGNKVHYIPGWDCHGLPIELKALSSANVTHPITVRSEARIFAAKAMEEQKRIFQSWGVIGDWKNSYQTFSVDYVKMQLRQFFKLYEKDFIYRDIKPVFWSPSSRTALAEAELEYMENHKSPSLYVRFKLKHMPNLSLPDSTNLYAIIWTTTPWTLPANSAVCYNDTMSYSLVKKSGDGDNMYLVGSELLESLSRALNCNFEVVQEFIGHSLEGATYIHPIFKEAECTFLPASHVTSNKGTGFVHTAPAHGPDDFLISITSKIPRVDIVDENGCYNKEAGTNLEGKFVLTEGNTEVIKLLGGDLVHLSEITHSYPYDWRTKKPVIIRASQQWFIDTNAIKDRATEILESVEIFPKSRSEIYKKDLATQIQKRPYWCISRQRRWGVPIPVFYDKGTSEIILNENTIRHHCNLLEKHGTDFWWKLSANELLPEQIYPNKSVEQGQDIMDIWLDSGLSWAKVLEGSKVADMYLEGVDQFRGWFQSSLLTSVAIRDKAPYKTIYVHGFAVDEDGNKMSKSLGNVIDPVDIVSGKKGQKAYGVDTLRWWVACHANKDALANVSRSVLQSSADEVQKIRAVLRFTLGGLADYSKSQKDQENLQMIDKYMIHLLYKFHQQVGEFTSTYQFHKVSQLTINLVTNPVSALYYSVIKDRLYCDYRDSPSRRAAQFTLLQIFEAVIQVIAPIIPHLAEEMYSYFPQKDSKTYFMRNTNSVLHLVEDMAVEDVMRTVLECKRDINKKYGANTSDVKVDVTFSKIIYKKLMIYGHEREVESQLTDIFQVSEVKVTEGETAEKFLIQFSKSSKFSCPRCWRVQSDKEHDLCRRCDEIVVSLNENKSSLLI